MVSIDPLLTSVRNHVTGFIGGVSNFMASIPAHVEDKTRYLENILAGEPKQKINIQHVLNEDIEDILRLDENEEVQDSVLLSKEPVEKVQDEYVLQEEETNKDNLAEVLNKMSEDVNKVEENKKFKLVDVEPIDTEESVDSAAAPHPTPAPAQDENIRHNIVL